MSTAPASELPIPPDIAPERTLSAPEWGMAAFLLSEVAFFSTLIVTYVAFMGRDVVGPTPAEALSLPIVLISTVCLVSSSGVIHLAEKALRDSRVLAFGLLLAATIALGVVFLALTGVEWYGLINQQHLTISRNLFGSTYYTLVGFHAAHVTVGVLVMSIVLALTVRRDITEQHRTGMTLIGWYWHFVDVVWIVVFFVVYIISRSTAL